MSYLIQFCSVAKMLLDSVATYLTTQFQVFISKIVCINFLSKIFIAIIEIPQIRSNFLLVAIYVIIIFMRKFLRVQKPVSNH